MLLRPPSRPARPVVISLAAALSATLVVAGCSEGRTGRDAATAASSPVATAPAPVTSPSSAAAVPATTTANPMPTPSTSTSTTSTRPRPTPSSDTRPASSSTAPAPRTVGRLPLDASTGAATQVVTVVASAGSDTRATVRRWTKSGDGWRQVGDAVDAYVGSDGIGRAGEDTSRTPAGSFTLTQAFGRDDDPGTRLPYAKTTSADYWISSPGPLYNTRQRCSTCGYDNGVNEQLREITPEYDYAAVIDYNTRNAPGGVRAGRGSAFFLHVADGAPTAGCVALPRADLVRVLTWLVPDRHPRILIGVD